MPAEGIENATCGHHALGNRFWDFKNRLIIKMGNNIEYFCGKLILVLNVFCLVFLWVGCDFKWSVIIPKIRGDCFDMDRQLLNVACIWPNSKAKSNYCFDVVQRVSITAHVRIDCIIF